MSVGSIATFLARSDGDVRVAEAAA
jgi:hypothetical protein